MFRNKSDIPKTKTTVNLTVTGGGTGDCIAYLVAVNYIVKELPWINLLIWVPDYLLNFAKHVLPKGAIIRNFTDAQKKYNKNNIGLTTKWLGQHTPMKTHPVDYAYHMLCDMSTIPLEYKNYLKIRPEEIDIKHFKLPEKYVTINIASTSKVKELPGNVINDISKHAIQKGYTPVYVGKKVSDLGIKGQELTANIANDTDFSLGIDLTDKTSLLEAAAVIAGSSAFIGMEGGLTHLAGCTDVSIISSYSFIDPNLMAPIRNGKIGDNCHFIVPDESLGCRFCQSNMPLIFDLDFRTCFYKDFLCVSQLTFNKFKEKMDLVL